MVSKDNFEESLNKKRIYEIFTPSWLSGLIAISTALILTFGIIGLLSFNYPSIHQQIINLENTNTAAPILTVPGQLPPGTNKNSLQNTWPLIAFWAFIGLISFYFIELIFQIFKDAHEFSSELNFVHANRSVIIKNAFTNLLVRIIAAGLWLVYIEYFTKKIIPFCILSSHASSSDFFSFSGIIDALISIIIIVLTVHIHTIFLRLVLRRGRVLSRADYLDV